MTNFAAYDHPVYDDHAYNDVPTPPLRSTQTSATTTSYAPGVRPDDIMDSETGHIGMMLLVPRGLLSAATWFS